MCADEMKKEYDSGKRHAVSFEGYVWRVVSIDFKEKFVCVRTINGDVWKSFDQIKTLRR